MENKRLESLDAFRGFDMIWICGFSAIVVAICRLFPGGEDCVLVQQMSHAAWDGLHFMDLIFPTFLFIAGVSFPYSYASSLSKGLSRGKICLRIFRRALILVLLGIVVNGFLKTCDLENARYCSVLGRIGLAWMFAALLYVFVGRGLRIPLALILLGLYYAILSNFIAPDAPYGADGFSMKGNIAGYIDRLYMPGSLYQGCWDPEGLLGIMPATVTAMLGVFTGEFVRASKPKGWVKALCMGLAAVLLIVLGLAWSKWFPINKSLWSSSFVLVAGGISLTCFALFYLLIDVLGWNKWAFPLKVVGMNSITIYVLSALVSFYAIANNLVGGLMRICGEPWDALIFAVAVFGLQWGVLYFLYKKKVFLKV